MAENATHPIRDSVIAGLILALILAIASRFFPSVDAFFTWIWGGITEVWRLLTAHYAVPGWLLLLLALVTAITAIRLVFYVRANLKEEEEPGFRKYTTEKLYGAVWRWRWSGNQIANLWCFCPRCDCELVYENPSIYEERPRTKFYCERCNHTEVASITADDVDYAKGVVEREIRRRLRTKEAQY
jgi:hypothetical protein